MPDYVTVFEANTQENAEIPASGSEIFLSTEFNRSQMEKFIQSFNALEIVNEDSKTIFLQLDNLVTRRRKIKGNSTFVIEPENEIYFNTVEIVESLGVSVIPANNVLIKARIAKQVLTPVVATQQNATV